MRVSRFEQPSEARQPKAARNEPRNPLLKFTHIPLEMEQ